MGFNNTFRDLLRPEDTFKQKRRNYRMKKIKLLLSTILLGSVLLGCSTNELQGWKVSKALEICKKRGGIDHLNYFVVRTVVCEDGYLEIINRPNSKEVLK